MRSLFAAVFAVITGAAAPQLLSAHAAPTDRFIVPATITHNCSKPVEGPLNAWLARVPDGATAVLRQGGCYALRSSLVLADRHNFTVEGDGATTKLVTSLRHPYSGDFANLSVWRVMGGSGVTLHNLTVRGDDPYTGKPFQPNDRGPECTSAGDLEWQHGVAFDGTDGGHLVGVNVNHVCGDFVEADTDGRTLDPATGLPPYETKYARNITVDGGAFTVAGRMGFGLVNVDGFTLRGARISYVNEAGIDMEPDVNSERATNVTVAGNVFNWVRFSLLSSGGAGENAGAVTFTRNTALGTFTCQPPVWVGTPGGLHRTGYTITDNNLNPYGALGMFVGVKRLVVSGNVDAGLYGNGGCGQDAGVVLSDAHTVGVSGNDFGPTVTTAVRADSASSGVVAVANTP